jgi:phosphoribosylamine--glycine ligase
VVAASSGYPGAYKTGLPISGLGAAVQVPGVQVFHAGSAQVGPQLLTAGGRVLGVTTAGESLQEALARAYQALSEIEFEGIYYRHDIGYRALRSKR